MPGVKTSMLQERAGYIFAVENDTDQPFGLQLDSNDSIGFVSSREGGACGCIDLVPPRSRKLVMALAVRQGASRASLQFGFEPLPAEAASWAVGAEDMHMALPLTPLARQQGRGPPDSSILGCEPLERKARPLKWRGGHKTPAPDEGQAGARLQEAVQAMKDTEAEDELAEALRLSLQDNGGQAAPAPAAAPDGGDDDDEEEALAQAIAMSMAQQQATAQAPSAASSTPTATAGGTAAAEATAAASSSGGGGGSAAAAPSADMKQEVKQLFEKYRAEGMSPNEAAAKALEDAKARRAAATSADLKQLVAALFKEYTEGGMAPNEAAAKAMQEAKKRLSQAAASTEN